MEQPEGRMDDRVVLLRRADLEPDSPQPFTGYQLGLRDAPVVVPQLAAVPRGLIGQSGATSAARNAMALPVSRRSRIGVSGVVSASRPPRRSDRER